MQTSIIAEVGVNHNGDVGFAKELISIASDVGANAVKFQTFKADRTIVRGAKMVEYQQKRANQSDQHKMLEELELTDDEFVELSQCCADHNVEFMSTAFDTRSLDFLVGIGMPRIKVPSGEVTNIPLLKKMAEYSLPVLLSTGMATLEEVQTATKCLQDGPQGNALDITILHCTSAYPAPLDLLNLRALLTIAETMKLPVGYSDHSQGILMAPVTVAMGATVLEKHITLDRTLPGPDHAASIEPDEFEQMVRNVRDVEAALGDAKKEPRGTEIETAKLVRRGLKAGRDMQAGEILTADDVAILRPETGLPPVQFDVVVGKTLSKAIKAGDALEADHFQAG